ncbi:MAG: hypothetical protein ACRD2O_14950 [Terriglobia bacterium]
MGSRAEWDTSLTAVIIARATRNPVMASDSKLTIIIQAGRVEHFGETYTKKLTNAHGLLALDSTYPRAVK